VIFLIGITCFLVGLIFGVCMMVSIGMYASKHLSKQEMKDVIDR